MAEAPRKRKSRSTQLTEERTDLQSSAKYGPPSRSLIFRVLLFVTKAVCVILSSSVITLLLVALLVTSPIDPVPYELSEPPQWTGTLEPDHALSRAEKMFENQLEGPESMVVRDGTIYTGTADGKVLRIKNGKIETLVQSFGRQPCGGYENEPTCGRPLGMRMHKDGYLVVLDAYLGVFKVDIETGSYNLLLPSSVKIGGKEPRFLNDLDISSDGTIYFSDSSTRWGRRDFLYAVMAARPDGRLVRYDVTSNTTDILIDNIRFANGVQLSKEEDFVLVAEPVVARILKYNLKGPKKGQVEVFADNLPGNPDNIRPCRRNSGGGFWVSMSCRLPTRYSSQFIMASRPYLRKLLTKLPLSFLHRISPRCVLVLQLSEDGEIVRALHDPTHRTIYSASEVAEHDGFLYLGSYRAPFIGKIPMPNKLN